MTICYFTASGNCLYVARQIGGKLVSIPQLMRQDTIHIEDDAVGIVCPVYAAEMPMMVRDFMKRAKIKTDYFFFIYTCGMGHAKAFQHVELLAREAKLELKYINAIQMVDNYLPVFDMQNQIDTLPQKDVDGQVKRVIADIANREERRVEVTEEDKAQMAMYAERLAISVLKKDNAKSYIVNDDCIHCGICAKVCPANNITVTEENVIFDNSCEVCYSCLHNCPKNAIHIESERSSARFRNEHVTINDIVEANE